MVLKETTELSDATRGIIIGMHRFKGKVSEISAMLDIPITAVKSVIRLYKITGLIVPPPKRTPRPKVLTERDIIAIGKKNKLNRCPVMDTSPHLKRDNNNSNKEQVILYNLKKGMDNKKRF